MTTLATHQTDHARTEHPSSPASPVLRWSKVMDAKAAIRDGRYDGPAEVDKLLDDCLSSMLIDLAE